MWKIFSYNIVALAVFALITSITYFFLNPEITGPLYDVAIFRYIGMLVNNGGIPYVDVFDHKPPIIYFFYALGHIIHYKWGVFFLYIAIHVAASFLIFSVLKKQSLWLAYAVSLLMCAAVLFFSHEINYGDIFATRYLLMYAIILFAAYSLVAESKKCIYFLSGFFLTFVFLLQTNEILAAFVFVVFILYYTKSLKFGLNNLLFIAGGAVMVVIPVVAYLIYGNAFSAFIYQAFTFNFNIYIPIHEDTFWNKLNNAYLGMEYINMHYMMLFLTILNVLLLVAGRNKAAFAIMFFVVLTFGIQLYATSISNNNYGHYYFPFIAYFICFLTVFAKENLFQIWQQLAATFFIISLAAFAVCINYVIIHNKPFEKYKNKQFENAFTEIEKNIPFEKIKNTRGTFFSWEVGNYITLNAKYNIIAPTKWVYSNGLIAPYFISNGIDEIIMNNITTHQTKYVLTWQLPNPHHRRTFLEENYKPVFCENVGINIWH